MNQNLRSVAIGIVIMVLFYLLRGSLAYFGFFVGYHNIESNTLNSAIILCDLTLSTIFILVMKKANATQATLWLVGLGLFIFLISDIYFLLPAQMER